MCEPCERRKRALLAFMEGCFPSRVRQVPAGVSGEFDVVRHATGRNYSVTGTRGMATVAEPLTAFAHDDGVAEPVRTSAWGQAMLARGPVLAPQHAPIPFFHGFRGFISNGIRVPGGLHPPVTFPQAYDGVMPLVLQPSINKPYPYNMPRYAPGVTSARTVVNDVELQGIVQRPT